MPKPRRNGWYGWKPDLPDHRDYKISLPPTVVLPPRIDLRPGFPRPYNQGNLGSCTANAIAGCLEFDQRKQLQKDSSTPSRLFIYYNERAMEGSIGEDSGAMIRDGIKSVNQLGAPPEKIWPYVENKFTRKPTTKAYREAKKHQSVRYERLDQKLGVMKACLASGFPFIFGFTVYDEFESDEVAKTGMLPMPKQNEKDVGGHAVVAAGYDDAKQMILVRNSWDVDWGIEGYFWMPYGYIADPNLADDMWTIRQVE